MNFKNSKTFYPHRLLLNLTDKINLTRNDMLLYQILAYTMHGKIFKKSFKNSKFKISAPTWNDKFDLPDGSYSVSDVQEYYFEYIFKKHREKTKSFNKNICK